jgi:RNAse (barnase) inhibitor barstar
MSRPAKDPFDNLPQQAVRPLKGFVRSELQAWARRTGQRLIDVDFDACTNKTEALRAIADAFALPSWFGMNLDALYDALTDLPDRDAGYLVLLEHLPRTEQFTREQRDALLGVFRDVGENFAGRGIPFRVLYS